MADPTLTIGSADFNSTRPVKFPMHAV